MGFIYLNEDSLKTRKVFTNLANTYIQDTG